MNLNRFCKETAEFIKAKKLIFIGEGRHRAVFKTRSGKYVIKIPTAEGGSLANYNEAMDFKNKCQIFGNDRLARCRYIDIAGAECLIMEFVSIPKKFSKLPDWTKYIDCQQVGYTRKKKLVAYDWS